MASPAWGPARPLSPAPTGRRRRPIPAAATTRALPTVRATAAATRAHPRVPRPPSRRPVRASAPVGRAPARRGLLPPRCRVSGPGEAAASDVTRTGGSFPPPRCPFAAGMRDRRRGGSRRPDGTSLPSGVWDCELPPPPPSSPPAEGPGGRSPPKRHNARSPPAAHPATPGRGEAERG